MSVSCISYFYDFFYCFSYCCLDKYYYFLHGRKILNGRYCSVANVDKRFYFTKDRKILSRRYFNVANVGMSISFISCYYNFFYCFLYFLICGLGGGFFKERFFLKEEVFFEFFYVFNKLLTSFDFAIASSAFFEFIT